MVGLGLLMIAVGLWSLWLRWRGGLFQSRPFLWLVLLMGPSGLIALLAGWFTTEVGRQPWVVYGLLRTSEGVSHHGALQMSVSLVVFVVVYLAVFGVGLRYMLRLIRKGPITAGEYPASGGPGQPRSPARPLSAATEGFDVDSNNYEAEK